MNGFGVWIYFMVKKFKDLFLHNFRVYIDTERKRSLKLYKSNVSTLKFWRLLASFFSFSHFFLFHADFSTMLLLLLPERKEKERKKDFLGVSTVVVVVFNTLLRSCWA